jgi:hypothetical protein
VACLRQYFWNAPDFQAQLLNFSSSLVTMPITSRDYFLSSWHVLVDKSISEKIRDQSHAWVVIGINHQKAARASGELISPCHNQLSWLSVGLFAYEIDAARENQLFDHPSAAPSCAQTADQ